MENGQKVDRQQTKKIKSWAEKDKSTQKTENGQKWTENRQVDKNQSGQKFDKKVLKLQNLDKRRIIERQSTDKNFKNQHKWPSKTGQKVKKVDMKKNKSGKNGQSE